MAGLWTKLMVTVKATTLEPVMLIDGAAINAMIILMECVQMYKTCTSTLGFSNEVCNNLGNHSESNILVQKELSLFTIYDNLIQSVVSFLFILFMGAWSDVYGRKFPLLLIFVVRAGNAAGYILALAIPSMPAETIYGASFLLALGGGLNGLTSTAFSYASDITSEENRTVKISTFSSLWFLGAPIGTILTGIVLEHSTYIVALSIVFGVNTFAFFYIIFFIKESCGPFAKIGNCLEDCGKPLLKKEDVRFGRMVADYINWKRVSESFHTLFRPRPGYNRALLLISVVSNMGRRASKGCFFYMFSRLLLGWDASLYSYWTTYRFLITSVFSLLLVPLVSKLFNTHDYALVAWGSVSCCLELVLYALVLSPDLVPLMWVSPAVGFFGNAQVALRSIPTKLVDLDEKGRVSSATGALVNFVRLASSASFTLIYRATVEYYPGAQFIFSAAINMALAVVFFALHAVSKKTDFKREYTEKHGIKDRRKISDTMFASSECEYGDEVTLIEKADGVKRSVGGCLKSNKPGTYWRSSEAIEAPCNS